MFFSVSFYYFIFLLVEGNERRYLIRFTINEPQTAPRLQIGTVISCAVHFDEEYSIRRKTYFLTVMLQYFSEVLLEFIISKILEGETHSESPL